MGPRAGRRSGIVALVLLVLLALLGAACGGGDGGGRSDLEALAAEAFEGVTAKVTYDVVTEVEGERFEGEWILVQRPPDFRFEIAGREGERSFRTIAIGAGDVTYLCFSGSADESCLTAGPEDVEEATPFDPVLDIPRALLEGAEDVEVLGRSRREIAGLDARCFDLRSEASDLGDAEICFSDGGLVLYLNSEAEGTSSFFEATSVSAEVSDDEFEPPFEVSEIDSSRP